MNTVGLNINVTSSTQSAVAGINQVTNSLNNAGSAAGSASSAVGNATSAINRLNPASTAAAAGVTNLANAVASGQASLSGISPAAREASRGIGVLSNGFASAAQRQEAFLSSARSNSLALSNTVTGARAAATELARLNASLSSTIRPTNNAGAALTDFGRVLQDAPFGFIAIQNNIPPLFESFGRLATSAGGAGAAFRALFSTMLGPAGIGFAVSAVTSALTFYFQSQQKATKAAKDAQDQIKSLVDINKDLAIGINQSSASAASEAISLNRLFDAAKNDTKSRAERLAALSELKKATNGYLGDLTLETVGTEAARKSLDLFNKSLFESALIKAYRGNIEDLAKAYAQNKDAADEGRKAIEKIDAEIAKAKSLGSDFDKSLGAGETRLDRIAKLEKDRFYLVAQTNKFINDQNAAQEKILSTSSKIADLKVDISPFGKSANAGKEIKTISDVLDELNSSLFKSDALFKTSGDSLQQLTDQTIGFYQKALSDLVDIDILPGNKIFDALKARLLDIQGTQQPVKVIIPIEPQFSIPKAVSNSLMTKEMGEDLQKTKFKPLVDKFTASLNDMIQTSIEGGIGSISEALGNALVTGDFTSVIGAFVESVAGFMQKLGVSLIATGIGLEAFKESLKNLNGFAAVAAGAALVVAAGAFRAIASGGIGSFATGGTAYGPQLALIGDNPQRKEHILSDSQLEHIAGSGSNEFVGKFVLDGQLLSLAISRADRRQRRVN